MKPALISLLAALALCVGAVPAQAGWWQAMHLDTHPGYDPGHSFLRDAVRGDDHSSAPGDGNWGDGNTSIPHLNDGESKTWAEVKHDATEIHAMEGRENHHYMHLWHLQEHHRRQAERCRALHVLYETRHPFGKPSDLRFHTGCSLWKADARFHDNDPFVVSVLTTAVDVA